jgi:hypothetical protein
MAVAVGFVGILGWVIGVLGSPARSASCCGGEVGEQAVGAIFPFVSLGLLLL